MEYCNHGHHKCLGEQVLVPLPVLRQYIYRWASFHDGWRSNEHGAIVLRAMLEGLQLLGHRELRLEGVDLGPEEVPLHFAVQAA